VTAAVPDAVCLEQELSRLCQDAVEERELIPQGRIDELVERIVLRQKAFEELTREAPPGALSGARCRELVQKMHDEGATTIALLSSVREELAAVLGHGQQVRQAAGRYETSGQL
jgi:hypothetical protein